MCVSTGPTWGVRPHLGLPRLPVRPDPGPRWGSRPAGEARVRPELGGGRGYLMKHTKGAQERGS